MKKPKYSINDFIYWFAKWRSYEELEEKIYSKSEIAYIIASAMTEFFDDPSLPKLEEEQSNETPT